MEEKPRRPWFRFRLRTLFVVVTVIALGLGWMLHWERARMQVLRDIRQVTFDDHLPPDLPGHYMRYGRPPWVLRLLEREGVLVLYLGRVTTEEYQRALELFPESIYIGRRDEAGNEECMLGASPHRISNTDPIFSDE